VSGIVPNAAKLEWVKTITKCHIGNGFGNRGGVDTSADVSYQKYISAFGEREVVMFLRLFEDPTFTGDFSKTKADERARALITAFKEKTTNVHVLRALDALLAQPAELLDKVKMVTKFKQAMAYLPKPTGIV
jgi:hypothetical protein